MLGAVEKPPLQAKSSVALALPLVQQSYLIHIHHSHDHYMSSFPSIYDAQTRALLCIIEKPLANFLLAGINTNFEPMALLQLNL